LGDTEILYTIFGELARRSLHSGVDKFEVIVILSKAKDLSFSRE